MHRTCDSPHRHLRRTCTGSIPGPPPGCSSCSATPAKRCRSSARHRGGARPGFPENCIATFEQTLTQTYAILEIDPRYTRDGHIVLHHDASLERTTTGRGLVAEATLAELKQLRLKDPLGNVTEHAIPTLDEALAWARGKTVLVLDQKDVPVADRVRKIEEHHAESYALLIVYTFRDAQACHALNPDIMMEVMIPDRERLEQFEALGVPWSHVIAFTGHTPPAAPGLLAAIHDHSVSCLAGTSRNLDRRFLSREVTSLEDLEPDYRALLQHGVDVIETDVPAQLGRLLYGSTAVPAAKQKYFHRPEPES